MPGVTTASPPSDLLVLHHCVYIRSLCTMKAQLMLEDGGDATKQQTWYVRPVVIMYHVSTCIRGGTIELKLLQLYMLYTSMHMMMHYITA